MSRNRDYLQQTLNVTSEPLTQDDRIDALFREALERLAHMPFTLVVDFWRWRVHDGRVPEEQWNDAWWQLR